MSEQQTSRAPSASSLVYQKCPGCGSTSIHRLAENSWFCLDCDWDTLSAIPTSTNDSLLASLRYGDVHARRIAAQALINIGDTERHLAADTDAEVLLEVLDDDDADVRYFVAVALGKLKASSGLKKLRQLVKNDTSALVREGARAAIEQIESCGKEAS